MRKTILGLTLAVSIQSFAAQDLTLPGEKWIATFTGYICKAFEPSVGAPAALENIKVNFEQLTTDSTLDHALLKANFEHNGFSCRYNAIILADNAAQDSKLVQSLAYDVNATNGAAYINCLEGKEILDNAFSYTKYLYYGHPHNLAFMLPAVGAESVCGADAKTIGVNFVVKGKVTPTSPVQ